MKIDILTIFPDFFSSPLNESIIKRAVESNLVQIRIANIRDFAEDKHKTTDDTPFGGGGGMVMMVEPLFKSISSVLENTDNEKIILLSAQGEIFSQEKAKELSTLEHLILVCGHYKGIDERIKELFPGEETSIGDYVLTGGELPALVILDSVIRLIPNAVGNRDSLVTDSFFEGILGYPEYTRPYEFMGLKVPEVLISGNHEKIRLWRRKEALRRTLNRRPELLEKISLSDEDKKILEQIKREDVN
jgi:tRNA (guanine37-N1)-methyltransferase